MNADKKYNNIKIFIANCPTKPVFPHIFCFFHIPLLAINPVLMKSHCRWTLWKFDPMVSKFYWWNCFTVLQWANPEKILDIPPFLRKTPRIFKFVTLPLKKFRIKQGFTPTLGNSSELCGTSCKFQGQKPKTYGWKFHMSFTWKPLEIPLLS